MYLDKFIKELINKGDIILFHNDLKKTFWLLKDFFGNDFYRVIQYFLDCLIDAVTEDGTILIPCFNWDFCNGLPFDYKNSKSQTGVLGNFVLKDKRFKRTKHPIYSFAVYGKYREYLTNLNNFSSFGMDSPFGFLFEKNGKIIMWDVDHQRSFTYAHFVEQQLNVEYRFEKIFKSKYIDEYGNVTESEYSMFVRNLDMGIITHLEPIGKILEDEGICSISKFQDIVVRSSYAREVFDRLSLELKRNRYLMVKFEFNKDYKNGQFMHDLISRLFPINRSITGEGFRKSLRIIKEYISELSINQIPSGEKCFDWNVPLEWNVKEAFVSEVDSGKKVIDFKEHNLHLVGYSQGIDLIVDFEELLKHLHYREDLPDAIPYVTSYYNSYWGFCIKYNDLLKLDKNKKYRVYIDATLNKGCLNYGECFIKGESDEEILFSTYLCHSSMANNELSGPALMVRLYDYLKEIGLPKYSYRLVIVPETIGSICYLSRNIEHLKKKLVAGFVLTCCGDEGSFSYLPSRYGNSLADKVVLNLLRYEIKEFKSYTFLERGSDERQYCSPGVDLPVCSVMKSKYGTYKYYHTSKDDLSFVTPKGLEESYQFYVKVIDVLENNRYFKNSILCEPQMGKRGLYNTVSHLGRDGNVKLMMDFLAYADGTNDLIDIANILGKSSYDLIEIKNILLENELLVCSDIR